MHCSFNYDRVSFQDHALGTTLIYLAPPFHSQLIFARSAQFRWGGARVRDRPIVSGVLVWMYVCVSFRAKMGRFLCFWVINESFYLSLPKSSIMIIFSFIFYFLLIFRPKKSKKHSILTCLRLKTNFKQSLFDLRFCECVYKSIKLIIGYFVYFIGLSFDFLNVKHLLFT